MARLVFPSSADQLVYAVTGTDAPILAKSGLNLRVYTDLACTSLADIQTLANVTIVNSTVVVDNNSLIPLFRGPDNDADTLFVRPTSVSTGNGSPIYAREDDRIDGKLGRTGGETITTSGPAVKGFVVKGSPGQTASLAEFQSDTGTIRSRVDLLGRVSVNIDPFAAGVDAAFAATPTSTAAKGLVVRGSAGQTANLAEFQNSAGAALATITAGGGIEAGGDLFTGVGAFFSQGVGAASAVFYGAAANIAPRVSGERGLIVRGRPSQTANLAEFQNSAGAVLAKVDTAGSYVIESDSGGLGAPGRSIFGGAADYTATISVLAGRIGGVGAKGLVVRGSAGQTGNLAEFQNSAGQVLTAIDPGGGLAVKNVIRVSNSNVGVQPDLGAYIQVVSEIAGAKGLVVRGSTGQTANLAEFQNSSGTVLAGIDALGRNIFNVVQVASTAATGAAAALPANPQDYIIVTLSNGVVRKIPAYNV